MSTTERTESTEAVSVPEKYRQRRTRVLYWRVPVAQDSSPALERTVVSVPLVCSVVKGEVLGGELVGNP